MKLLVGHFGYLLFPKFVGELANHATGGGTQNSK